MPRTLIPRPLGQVKLIILSMITVANALLAALAYLQTQPAGHTISMPTKCCKREEIADWCEKHGLRWWINGPTLTLQLKEITAETPQ